MKILIMVFIVISSLIFSQYQLPQPPQQQPFQTQPTIPNYPVPQWLKKGLVLIYNFRISGQQGVPTQQMPMQVSGNLVFLVEDVGQYSFVFRMFQVISNPPTLSTSVSGGSGTMSTFHVNPKYLQDLARGANPNMTIQGNTIIMKGQGTEQRITVDPGTGIMMNMSVSSQGNVTYSLNYAGYTYISLPQTTGLPNVARGNYTYTLSVESQMYGGAVQVGTISYNFTGENQGFAMYNVSMTTTTMQRGQMPSSILFGGSFEGPFYINPQVFVNLQPGSVIYTIQNTGIQLVHGGMEGNFVRLQYMVNGKPLVTEYVDPNTGLRTRIVTTSQMGKVIQQLSQTPAGGGLPTTPQLPGGPQPPSGPQLPGGGSQPPLPPSGGGTTTPSLPGGGASGPQLPTGQPQLPGAPQPAREPQLPSTPQLPPTSQQIPGPSQIGEQATEEIVPFTDAEEILEFNEYPVPKFVKKGLILFRKIQEEYLDEKGNVSEKYIYYDVLIVAAIHQKKALALRMIFSDDMIEFESTVLRGLCCTFVNPDIVQDLVNKGFSKISQGNLKVKAGDEVHEWFYDEETGLVKKYVISSDVDKMTIELLSFKNVSFDFNVTPLERGAIFRYEVNAYGEKSMRTFEVRGISEDVAEIRVKDDTGYEETKYESAYLGDFYVSPQILENGFFDLSPIGVNVSVSKEGNNYVLNLSGKGSIKLIFSVNGIMLHGTHTSQFESMEVKLVR